MTPEIVDTWAHLIEQHGLSLVLLLLLLFLFFIPWVKKMMAKTDMQDKSSDNDHLIEVMHAETEIGELLGKMCAEYKASWVMVWQFHNNTASLGGVPFYKMSITNEFASVEVQRKADRYQNIPISFFSDVLDDIAENGSIFIGMDSPHTAITSSYKSEGIQNGYMLRLNNSQGKFIGMLSMTFTKLHEVTSNEVKTFAEYGDRISMILNTLSASYESSHHRRTNDR